MLFYVLSFLLLLGPLVFVHELGHFIFAKLFNVRVDVFSMGFGPRILKKKWGETEYCISIIPLGGYVKLFGQDPTEVVTPEQRSRSLTNLEPWKRFLVFVGGPLFNFLFAILVFAFMLILGEPHMAPVVARVPMGSQAHVAGFRSGDTIVAVNRAVTTNFDEVAKIVTESPNKELAFRVRSKGEKTEAKEIKVVPRPIKGLNVYGETVEVGTIDGLFTAGRHAVVGISDANSIAAKAGFKTGDEILTINSKPVKSFEHLLQLVEQELQSAKEFSFGIAHHELKDWLSEKKIGATQAPATTIKLPARRLQDLGLHSSELFVASLVPGSPAEKSGIQVEDRLVAFDDVQLSSFQQLRELVQEAGEDHRDFQLTVERQGKAVTKKIIPVLSEGRDAVGQESKQYMMGVFPFFVQSEPEVVVERILNPFTLTIEAWSRAIDLSAKTLVSIKKLIFRQVSMGTLGGPILIGKLAGDSMLRGLAQFLKVMAMISISLAIFNILPVPVLDGGHIFLLFVEVIRGKPITIRQSEMVQQVGLSLIVLLLVVVLFNDITRVGLPALRNIFH